ncbi:MAG: hypothetical protein EPN84_02495 [Legionella sp.]|nr:MAG: hypothetical protein EPN84_02495 [Legionella sp.]
MLIIKILAIIAGWLFFYYILKSRNKGWAVIKATIITLLFASLIFRFSDDLTAWVNKKLSNSTTQEVTVSKSSDNKR